MSYPEDYEFIDKIICPYCNNIWEYWKEGDDPPDEGEYITTCKKCGKKYIVDIILQRPDYTMTKLEGWGGNFDDLEEI